MMSKCVRKEEQGNYRVELWCAVIICYNTGALFGFVTSVEALATLLGSAVFINLYTSLHQQSYFIMAVLSFIAGVPLW